jgi:iron complex transport system ATP-binding protein
MSLLSAEGLMVRRGGRAVVDGVSLAFEPGTLAAVIGPNGAGKSTLLGALAGLVRPDAGRVALDGWPLAQVDRRTLARRRAYLPQSPRAEWPISVERLVALGLTPHLPAFGGLPEALAARVAEALERFDLTRQRDQPATTLSGGELARAMLARALVGDPEVLVADEPIAGLDPRHALDGVRRLRALADAGTLVVFSLHDLSLAARYATRLVALRDGRVVADGPTAEVLTPELLGHVFEVEARVTGTGQGASVDFVGAGVSAPGALPAGAATGRRPSASPPWPGA